ncbi:PspC domain-containing protein [Nesterenkonia pannonica]|uniref:PspC domain-containing protein n=1 Tax=Nesterenkonia pannonica TaxID=1548602 RepID=UPI00216410C1|nr:PspC domain-containing protein [Nesterenkonia pannonica]
MSDKEHRDARPVGSGIFEWVRSTGWHRPHSSWVGGVLAAVGDRLGWDAALVRGLGVLAFIVATAPTALLYGLAWILLPDRKGQIHAERALRGDFTSGAAAGGLLAVVGLLNLFTPAAAGPSSSC